MKRFFLLVTVLCCSLWVSAAQDQKQAGPELQKAVVPAHQDCYVPSFKVDAADKLPVNVILMIGDGMGLGHVASAMYANGGELTVTSLRSCGWVRTQSASSFVTDSAASGTAYATGSKTHNSGLGVDKDNQPLENIPELVQKHGVVSGVVTTDRITGATPAAFYAHQSSRKETDGIWGDLPGSSLIFFAGADAKSFKKAPEAARKAIEEKYKVVTSLDDESLKNAPRVGYLPEKAAGQSKHKGRGDYLPATTAYAIDFLKAHCQKNKGFFLMVEGAKIDHSAHGNDYQGVVEETLDFDKAVEAAIRFAEKDGKTLVIISADHETGGLIARAKSEEEGTISASFSSRSHSPMPVPLFAYGPCSQYFTGVQENSDVALKIKSILSGHKPAR